MKVPHVPIEILATTRSTMDVARSRVLEGRVTFDGDGAPSCWGVLAEEQTAGRGQRGRVWHAVRGESLCATYYVRHRFELPAEAARISLMAAVAVSGLLESQGSLQNIALKWPNDILIGGKKAGGILIEMVRAPDGGWAALVGVGINLLVSEFPEDMRDTATSLALESSDPATLPAPDSLAFAIAATLNSESFAYKAGAFPAWLKLWRNRDASAGRRYETEWNGVTAAGVAQGIDDAGALLLRLDDGTVAAVTSASSLRELT